MYYSEEDAKKLIIEAGHRLLESGFTARTWGNISARISDDEFLITPSGRAYDTLGPEDLVKVRTKDLSYEGNIKPSSEKGVHAISYVLRPNVGFVIHTHQFFASAVGVDGKDTKLAASCGYELPGTEKLRASVMKAISKNPAKNAFLMPKHGALALGEDCSGAFEVIEALEAECKSIFEECVGHVADGDYITAFSERKRWLLPYIDDFAQILGVKVDMHKPAAEICCGEDAEAEHMILEKNCAAALYAARTKARPIGMADAQMQRIVYLTKYSKLKK